MLKDTLEMARQAQLMLEESEDALLEAQKVVGRLNEEIDEAERRLRVKKEDTDYPNNFANLLLNRFKKEGYMTSILIQEIDEAINQNPEFERTPYKAALYEVAGNSRIYDVFKSGNGWYTTATVYIHFELEAGNLNDWADAVDAFRQELKTKIDPEDDRGNKATQWWLYNVYRGPLEAKTILSRLSYAARTAPFWQILNSGSQPLASDRGDGSYNPVPSTPTDFIGRAEDKIRDLFNTRMAEERSRWLDEIFDLENDIMDAVRIRDQLEQDVHKITTSRQQNRGLFSGWKSLFSKAEKEHPVEEAKRNRAGDEFSVPTPEDTNPEKGLKGKLKKGLRGIIGGIEGLFK